MRRRDLPDRMPQQIIRPHPTRPHHLGQRHLEREQRRLREHRLIQQPRRLGPLSSEHHLPQRPPQRPVQKPAHLIQHTREHRRRPIQLTPHPRTLRPLTRKQQRHLRTLHRRPHHNPTRHPTPTKPHQPSTQIPTRLPHHNQPMPQRRTPHQRLSNPRHIHHTTTAHKLPQPHSLRPQTTLTPPRHHPRHRTNHHTLRYNHPHPTRHHTRLHHRSLLHNHMRIRPTHTERRHTRPPHTPTPRPRHLLRQQRHRTRRPIHKRRRLTHMQRPRQPLPLQRHQHLDDTGHTGDGLGMAHIGLERTQPDRTVGGTVLAVRRQQRLRLDRITQPRTRTVRLHRIHIRNTQTRIGQRLPNHPLLRRTVRRRQTTTRTILIHRRTTHHTQHPMTQPPSIRQPLQRQHAHTFAPGRPVRIGRERLHPAVSGQTPLARELHEGGHAGQYGHAAGQRERALALPQGLDGQVHRHQRRRTRRVHRHRRTLETERVGDTPRQHTLQVSGQRVALDFFRHALQIHVGRRRSTHEDTGLAAAQRHRIKSRAFQYLPGDLQQQPLLRVHRQRLTRRDPEELGIEFRDAVQESAPPDVRLPRPLRVRVVQVLRPATVVGEVRRGVHPVRHQLPQVLRRTHPTGEPAGHAHHRDRLDHAGLDLLEPATGLVQVGGYSPKIFNGLLLVHH